MRPTARADETELLATARSRGAPPHREGEDDGAHEADEAAHVAFGRLAEPHRRELQVHCYRMLGSLQDAEDLVQETLLRAWQKLETYEGRASFRAWLYKIATNLCLDALDRRPKRKLPAASQPASGQDTPVAPPVVEPIWLEPFPDELLAEPDTGPEARYTVRESISLAFLAALQILPPRQRAVLLLRDVLDWHADEVATLLGLTLSAVNSALHRARTTLARHYQAHPLNTKDASPSDESTRALLGRYIHAWESADIEELIALLKEDATYSMPPMPSWYRGRDSIRALVLAVAFTGEAGGRWRLQATHANGQTAVAVYQRDETGCVYRPFGISVLTFEQEQIADTITFINPALFLLFGLPAELAV